MSDPQTPASESVRIVRCPHCGGDSVYAPSNPARPFCSARCKGLDLGAWAAEEFRVQAPPNDTDPDSTDTPLQ